MDKYQTWYCGQIDRLLFERGAVCWDDPDAREIYNEYYYRKYGIRIRFGNRQWKRKHWRKVKADQEQYYIKNRLALILYQCVYRLEKKGLYT